MSDKIILDVEIYKTALEMESREKGVIINELLETLKREHKHVEMLKNPMSFPNPSHNCPVCQLIRRCEGE